MVALKISASVSWPLGIHPKLVSSRPGDAHWLWETEVISQLCVTSVVLGPYPALDGPSDGPQSVIDDFWR